MVKLNYFVLGRLKYCIKPFKKYPHSKNIIILYGISSNTLIIYKLYCISQMLIADPNVDMLLY